MRRFPDNTPQHIITHPLKMDQLLLLEHLTYLHAMPPLRSILSCEGMTVGEVLDSVDLSALEPEKNYGSYITGFDWANIIRALKRQTDLLDIRILRTYMDMEQGGGGGISIVMLWEEGNQAIVAFRGTAPNEWADDFAAGSVISTPQQENALRWYQKVYQELELENYYVIIMGHSKGGNKAKFITVLDNTPERCVSFDGQGFSDKFINYYAEQIVLRKDIIENHNVDYDYVNILLNDFGRKYYYKGFDYGKGGLAESHCPNTYFDFHEDGSYTIILSENGQSEEMQELDKFLNSFVRSTPSDLELSETTLLLGELIEKGFALKDNENSLNDYINYLCEMITSHTYQDNVAFLFSYIILYERKKKGFVKSISKVMNYFNMEGMVRYTRMVQSLLTFPGLGSLIKVAGFFSGHIPEHAFVKMQDYIRERFDIILTHEQMEGMLSIVKLVKTTLPDVEIRDDGTDIVI